MRKLYILMFLVLSISIVQAQANPTCPAIVEEALSRMETNCSVLDRNNACYGYYNVQAEVVDGMGEGYFTQPADVAALSTLLSIHTAALDPVNNYWGIVAMRLQANLPTVLPGQSAVMVLMGDATLENANAVNATAPLEQPLAAQTLEDTNIRSGPGMNYPIVSSFASGSPLQVDGRNGDWVRVIYGDALGWVLRDYIALTTEATLPEVGPGYYDAPMQAFYFSTGIGELQCLEAPNLVMVQGPNRTAIDIQANGADIRITSTIALRSLPDNRMQLFTLSGAAHLDGVTVPRGFTVEAQLQNNRMVGEWSEPRVFTAEEATLLQTARRMAPSLMYYQPNVPQPADLAYLQEEYHNNEEASVVVPEITETVESVNTTAREVPTTSNTLADDLVRTGTPEPLPEEAPIITPIVPGF